ncbi:SWF or SNF family helicase [Streptomyces bungoensis]|uniref:SWF or SNF family helicase n=1 Tax=Streptomyces bungoensis TaxID=285568 RepID=A0A101TB84_9ACTN|nr:hypothetical protein [Streptomyces bungoensis]KUN89005.1 SWF or SNF family helicase [Streptomyces bungoensis]
MNGGEHEHDRHPERTFAALPPLRGREFARTWWGRAWLAALEEAALDSAAVKAGRRLARAGGVGAVTVRPGRVTAVVREPDGVGHRADVLVPELPEERWVRFLDLTVEQAGHLAALLDGELPPHLVEDAAIRGVDLLPGTPDLEPECDCGTWDHCAHTAALCHQVARLLDEDPFVLLLLRGRTQGMFLRELHRRSALSPGVPAEGVDAAEAWAAAGGLPPVPPVPGLPESPGEPASFGTDTAPPPGIDPTALAYLAACTAVEAHRLLGQALHERGAVVVDGSVGEDAVRLAAGKAPGAVAGRLAEGSGRGRKGLSAAVRAWRAGGAPALAVLDEEWRVEGAALARARAALEAAWESDDRPAFRQSGNRWTVHGEGVQLRLGRDDRWWPYRDEDGRWLPAGAADRNPATAVVTARLGTGDPFGTDV